MSMISVTPTSGLSTTKAGGQASFSLSLNAMPLSNVVIPLQVSNAKEASISAPTLIFSPNNWNRPQQVVVTGLDDRINGDTLYTIVTQPAISSDPLYNGTNPADVTVVNSDAPRRQEEASAQDTINMLVESQNMDMSMSGSTSTMNGPVFSTMPNSNMLMDMTAMTVDLNAVNALVDLKMVTAVAIQSGNWSDPDTWQNRAVPATGANVWIMPGSSVQVDGQFPAALHTIRVSGTLQFATNTNTSLRVNTLVVDPTGYLQIGTASQPIGVAYTAAISFIDDGPTDRNWDPQLLSRGLIALGKVVVYGQQTSGHATLAKVPSPGDTQLVLTQSPKNWKPGDHIVLPGTSFLSDDDENFVITATSPDGKTITLDHPVANTRIVPDPSLSLYVANTTRNVTFSSENPGQIDRRGGVEFMQTLNVDVEYASFIGLGRTDKSQPVNDVGPGNTYNSAGKTVADAGSNPRGSYAVHFHHSGGTLSSVPAKLIGCVVLGSPGWGIVNHSSDVIINDNVTVGVYGAGFATENGDELGSFTNNIAIRGGGRGVSFHATPSEFYGDLGYSGSGFWFQGLAGITVSGNIATGSNQSQSAGIIIQQSGLFNTSLFPVANLKNPSVANGVSFNWHGATYALVNNLPALPFSNNVVYGSTEGIDFWYGGGSGGGLKDGPRSVFDGLKIFDVATNAFGAVYSRSFTIENSAFYGNYGTPYESPKAEGTTGIYGNFALAFVDVKNTSVVGFWVGYAAPVGGTNSITGGFFNNYISVSVTATTVASDQIANFVLNISGVKFSRAAQFGNNFARFHGIQYDVRVGGYSQLGSAYGHGFEAYFDPMTILIDGKQLYLPEQAPSYQYAKTGTVLDGLTNAQAFAKYGIKARGAFTPSDAIANSRILGAVIGSPSNQAPMPSMTSPGVAPISQNYQLQYTDNTGKPVTDPGLIKLQKGLNFITRVINGVQRIFLVNGS